MTPLRIFIGCETSDIARRAAMQWAGPVAAQEAAE